MNEEAIFAEAIEKGTPEARAAYLDQACGGDATYENASKHCSPLTTIPTVSWTIRRRM